MESHEREEAEVARHGDTATVVLWTGSRQSLGATAASVLGEMVSWDAQRLWVYPPT